MDLPSPSAWLISFGDRGMYKALMLDATRALNYAASTHGTVEPMYTLAQVEKLMASKMDKKTSGANSAA